MSRTLFGLILLSVGLLIAQAGRPLTKDQVTELIGVLPDKALAREIRQRGVSFRVNRPTLQGFQEKGAGAETMASLAELSSNAQLMITSVPPNCDVSLNGRLAGSTDDRGKLIISDLDAGRAELSISKDGYKSRTYNIDLVRNQTAELQATLDRAIGYLLISVVPGEASVTVRSKDVQTGPDTTAKCRVSSSAKNLWECAPGMYTISASQVGFIPVAEDVQIVEEQTKSASLTMLSEPVRAPALAKKVPTRVGIPSTGASDMRRAESDALRLLAAVQLAMGGKARLAAVRDWQQRAKQIWEPSKGTTEITTMFAAPSSIREESKGGNQTANYSDGSTGWTWSTTHQVVRNLPTATARGMSFRVLDTLLLSDDDKERTVKLASFDAMVFSDKYSDSATLTVDMSNHLPKKLTWRNLDGAVLEETYSDWRKIGDLMWWFHMSRTRDGKSFLEVRVKDYRINSGLDEQALKVQPGQQVSRPRPGPAIPQGRVEVKTDGDRRGTLILLDDRIEYRDEGMGTDGGKAPYGPNPENNFTLSCSDIESVKAYGFRRSIFGSFEIVITVSRPKVVGFRDSPAPDTIRFGVGIKPRRSKFHIPALNSEVAAKAIQDRCGISPGDSGR